MAHVREIGPPGRKLLNVAERVGDGGVRRMESVAQGVQYQHVQAAQLLHGLLGNVALVRNVGGLAEAEAEDGQLAVENGYRRDSQAEQIQGFAVQLVDLELGNGGLLLLAVESIGKAALDGRQRVG